MAVNYKVIDEEVSGDVTITQNSRYNRMNADTVTVEPGIRARLFGTIKTKLIIREDARVFLHGDLIGELENQGGRLYHFDD